MGDRRIGVDVVEFSVPELNSAAEGGDLSTALTGLSGVAQVHVDRGKHSVTVGYDPGYVSEVLVEQTIKHAGYPGAQRAGVGAGSPSTSR
jgi:copper chaperone CopZ